MKDKVKKLLHELYWTKELSTRQIAKLFGKKRHFIMRKMKKYNISRRKVGHKIPKIDKNQLYDLYIGKELSTHKIAKILNCSQSFIRKQLKNYNILVRDKNQARLMQFKREETRKNMSKAAFERWSDISYQKKMSLVRGGTGIPYENTEYPKEFYKIREEILIRDNYTCQNQTCNSKNDLSIHHIDYDKFNCKEDNLITLCYSCNSKANFNKDYWYAYFKEVFNVYR